MIKDLAKLATRLDRLGLTKEADVLDAVMVKLAQQTPATTGTPGAFYVGGKKLPYTRPTTYVKKFYHSKPKDLAEFNQYLGEIIKNISAFKGQKQFSPQVVNNPPSKTDTTWTPKTQAAFKEYAIAAGFPEAGQNWQEFAKKNDYEPTLLGIYRFWVDTIENVERESRLDQTLQSLAEPPTKSETTGAAAASGTGVTPQQRAQMEKRVEPFGQGAQKVLQGQ